MREAIIVMARSSVAMPPQVLTNYSPPGLSVHQLSLLDGIEPRIEGKVVLVCGAF